MKPLLLPIILLMPFLSSEGYSQIRLPKDFHCVLGKSHMNESYFTNGRLSFREYPWGHEGIYGKDVTNAIEETYHHQIKFQRTKDGIYWASGQANGKFVYILLVNEALQFTLSSTTNSADFSNYSTWMLQQIRINKSAGLDVFFTDYRGKSCSGVQ